MGLPKSNSNTDYWLFQQCYHTDTEDHYIPITLPRCLQHTSDAWLWHASTVYVFDLHSSATTAIVL